MIQKTYHFNRLEEIPSIIQEVKSCEAYKNASSTLMQLYNPRVDIDEEKMVAALNNVLPKAFLCGISAANIAGGDCDLSEFPVELSFTFFKDTTLVQFDFDMDSISSFQAGRQMNEALEAHTDVK